MAKSKNEFLSLHEVISRSYETFGVFGGEKPRLIPTGIKPLDDRMGGILPGTLWFLGARTNKGKSTLLQNMGFAAAAAGYTVLYVSGEDPESLVGGKVQSRFSRIPLIDLSRLGYTLGGDAGVRRALEQAHNYKFYSVFPKARSLPSIIDMLKEAVATIKPDIVYFDYLTTITASGLKDRRVFYTEAVETLRDFANNMRVPVVCGSQITRRGGETSDNYEISRSELSETGAIENSADVILLIWSTPNGDRFLKVDKNKIAGHVMPRMKLQFDPVTEEMSAEEIA